MADGWWERLTASLYSILLVTGGPPGGVLLQSPTRPILAPSATTDWTAHERIAIAMTPTLVPNQQAPQRIALDEHAEVLFYERFLQAEDADMLLQEFLEPRFPWEHQKIRGMATRRANAWFADDPSFVYRYSGQVWPPRPLSPSLRRIADVLERTCQAPFNSVLAALYPDGRAGVAWHDDDDFPSQADSPIATVSFGAPRRFKVRRKSDREVVAQFDLGHGSMIVMGGSMQRRYEHTVAKTSRQVGTRVNLSYRVFGGGGEPGDGMGAAAE